MRKLGKKIKGKKGKKTRSPSAAISSSALVPTEADFEARVHAIFMRLMPWLAPSEIRHQTKLRITLGHTAVDVDGRSRESINGRSDILILRGDRPLAILELKRQGVRLTTDDEQQGLSYARVLPERPPLVIVSNGNDCRILTTHDGQPLVEETIAEEQVAKLLQSAAKLATEATKNAIQTLLGPEDDVWVGAFRATTDGVIADLSGTPTDNLKPFVPGLLLPRKATRQLFEHIQAGSRAVIIEGPPLYGKSNVLREFGTIGNNQPHMVVLYIEAGSGLPGLFQTLANVLANYLGWPATVEEVRLWLRNIAARQHAPVLVLAIDGLTSEHRQMREDIEEIIGGFGPNVRLIVSIDDTQALGLLRHKTGRQLTGLGRAATRLELSLLDDDEFETAQKVLWSMGIVFMKGAALSPEYRVPWLLRSILGEILESRRDGQKGIALVPSLMSLHLLAQTRKRFEGESDLLATFRSLAACVLDDVSAAKPIALTLESIIAFVVTQQTMKTRLSSGEIAGIVSKGLAKLLRHTSGEDVLVPRLPELLVSELANLLGQELSRKVGENGERAAEWLVNISERLPLGDLIGAQSIVDAANLSNGIPIDFIGALIARPPKREAVQPGMRVAANLPRIGKIDLVFNADQSVTASAVGHPPHRLEFDDSDGELMEMYKSMGAWLILSHLATMNLMAVDLDGESVASTTPAILMEVGASEIPLRRPDSDRLDSGYYTHDLREHGITVCHKSGIVEPITKSLVDAILGGLVGEDWLREAVERNSFPLLSRLDIALDTAASLSAEKARWAHQMLDTLVRPALREFIRPH